MNPRGGRPVLPEPAGGRPGEEVGGHAGGGDASMRDDEGSRLAREFRQGREESFADLVVLFRDRLYRLAFRLTGRQEDALDVVQETFVKVYRDVAAWNERSAFYSWLYRVASNLAIDRLRRRRKERELVQGAAAAEQERGERNNNIEDLVEASDRDAKLRRLRAAVEGLPEAQREIVVLRHFEGLSLKEIADARGCALGTVKSTLHQAFRSLVRVMNPEAATFPAVKTSPLPLGEG